MCQSRLTSRTYIQQSNHLTTHHKMAFVLCDKTLVITMRIMFSDRGVSREGVGLLVRQKEDTYFLLGMRYQGGHSRVSLGFCEKKEKRVFFFSSNATTSSSCSFFRFRRVQKIRRRKKISHPMGFHVS